MIELSRAGRAILEDVARRVASAERDVEEISTRIPGDILLLETVKMAPPVLRPEKIIGIGLNYRDHCLEMGRELPTELLVFSMFANGLTGSGDVVILPSSSSKMDYEAELVAVIGRTAKNVSSDQALEYLAGFTIGNDISARDHQTADPLTMRGKCGDTHAPVGPWIVTKDEIVDPGRLTIELKVNGVIRQSSSTRELVFSVAEIVSFLSRCYTLKLGDLIFTGTPAGVAAAGEPPPWLKPGDSLEVFIEGIGTLHNRCVAESEVGLGHPGL